MPVKPAILCVDDEVAILKSLRRQLKQAFQDTYIYESAESAEEALDVIEELQKGNIGTIVIVSDWLMPGMKGDDFLIEVHKKYPNVIKILLTGQANEEAIDRATNKADLHRYIHKPWEDSDLIECIESGLAKLELAKQ
jgi:CheY-like chemotaxis protein